MPTIKVWLYARIWKLSRQQKEELITKERGLHTAISFFQEKMSVEKRFILPFFQNDLQENTYLKLHNLTLGLKTTDLENP